MGEMDNNNIPMPKSEKNSVKKSKVVPAYMNKDKKNNGNKKRR